MNSRRLGGVAAVLAVIALILIAPIVLARLTWPDAPAPAGLNRPIRAFGDEIWHLFEKSPLTYARFVDVEMGPDDLVILYFETRKYPYFGASEEVYLYARCAPIHAIEVHSMGGGTVVGSRATDSELVFLRTGQPACPLPLR